MTTVEALKDLYVALGGDLADVQDMSTNVAVLNAISAKYSGASDAVLNPEAVENIAAVAGDIGGGGGGENDFSTAEVTINNGNGLTSLEIATYVDYPSDNPNSSNDMSYKANFVIGDTQSSSPPTIDSTQTITLLTYQNEGMINWPIYGNNEALDTVTAASVNITGNAELVTGGEYDYILVTGDCELTITWS